MKITKEKCNEFFNTIEKFFRLLDMVFWDLFLPVFFLNFTSAMFVLLFSMMIQSVYKPSDLNAFWLETALCISFIISTGFGVFNCLKKAIRKIYSGASIRDIWLLFSYELVLPNELVENCNKLSMKDWLEQNTIGPYFLIYVFYQHSIRFLYKSDAVKFKLQYAKYFVN